MAFSHHLSSSVAVGVIPEKPGDRLSESFVVLHRFAREAFGSVATPERQVTTRIHQLHRQFKITLYDWIHRDRAAAPTPIPAPTRPPIQGRAGTPVGSISVFVTGVQSAFFDYTVITHNDIRLPSRPGLSISSGSELELDVMDKCRYPYS